MTEIEVIRVLLTPCDLAGGFLPLLLLSTFHNPQGALTFGSDSDLSSLSVCQHGRFNDFLPRPCMRSANYSQARKDCIHLVSSEGI